MRPPPSAASEPALARGAQAERWSLHGLLLWRALWGVLLLALLSAVSALALVPAPPKGVDMGWDKLNHVAAFMALGCAARLWLGQKRHASWHCALGLLVYGAAVEVAQSYLPSRSAEWADLLADGVGLLLGLAIAHGLGVWARHSALAHSARRDNLPAWHR